MAAVSRAGGSRDGNCAIGHGLRGVKVPPVLGCVEQFIGAICAATRGVPTEPRRLAFLSIAIGMAVAPIPVLILLLGVQCLVLTKVLVLFPRVLTVGLIFVFIPIVVVLVGTIVDSGLLFVVSFVIFLTFVVLSDGPGRDRTRGKQCGR